MKWIANLSPLLEKELDDERAFGFRASETFNFLTLSTLGTLTRLL